MHTLRCLPRTLGMSLLIGLAVAKPSPAQEQSFQAMFDSYVQKDEIVGAAYVIVNKNQVTEPHTLGMADLEARQPVNANTIFHWASITKTLTAVTIMQLRDRAKLSLDDPIVKYVPELTRVHSDDNSMPAATDAARLWPRGVSSIPESPRRTEV